MLLFCLYSFFKVLTRITGCASWTEFDVPYDTLLRDAGVSIPSDFCSMAVPICTELEFGDGIDEALSELASQLGSFISTLISTRRRMDGIFSSPFCSSYPGITFGLMFSPDLWSQTVRKFLSLDKMRFSKLEFRDIYMIHLMDISLTPTASLEFDLKWPCL